MTWKQVRLYANKVCYKPEHPRHKVSTVRRTHERIENTIQSLKTTLKAQRNKTREILNTQMDVIEVAEMY